MTAADEVQVWMPVGHRVGYLFGLLMGALWGLQALAAWGDGRTTRGLLSGGVCLLMVVGVVEARRRRVETDTTGITVHGLVTRRCYPWGDVRDLRPGEGRAAHRILLELEDGRIVRLPLNTTTHRALFGLWRAISADR